MPGAGNANDFACHAYQEKRWRKSLAQESTDDQLDAQVFCSMRPFACTHVSLAKLAAPPAGLGYRSFGRMFPAIPLLGPERNSRCLSSYISHATIAADPSEAARHSELASSWFTETDESKSPVVVLSTELSGDGQSPHVVRRRSGGVLRAGEGLELRDGDVLRRGRRLRHDG
jgi:hypothetical protein